MDQRISVYALLVLIGALCAFGDAAIYHWAKTGTVQWWAISSVLWIVAATLLGLIFQKNLFSLSIGAVLTLVVHCVVVLIIDRLYYGTKLPLLQWGGIAFFAVGITLVEIGRESTTPQIDKPATVSPENE